MVYIEIGVDWDVATCRALTASLPWNQSSGEHKRIGGCIS